MEHYEKREHEGCEFKKYVKMTMDLMVDSYKWRKLSEYAEDYESKEKYNRISKNLHDMFIEEHENLMKMYKGE